jgi:hypothetical protein
MNLMDLLPSFYEGNKSMEELQGVLSDDVSTMIGDLQKTVDECFVNTAFDTLKRYEDIFGIKTDVSKSLADRRSRIKGKMRARGVTTVGVIRKVAESFAGDQADVRVIEHNPEYRFIIRYIETLGQPPDYKGLAESVKEIKPAHLAWSVEFDERVPGQIGISAISKFGVILTLYPWQVHHYESVSTVRTAAAVKSCLSVTVLERS